MSNDYWNNARGVMTVSTWKRFAECEAGAMAEISGVHQTEEKDHFLIGSYVDCALLTPDKLDDFIEANADAMLLKSGKNKGGMKAPFAQADAMIAKAKADPTFMAAITGQSQVEINMPVVVEDDGGQIEVPLRMTLDCVCRDNGILTDLKTVRTFDWIWTVDEQTGRNVKRPFYEVYGYWTQVAVYIQGYVHRYGDYPELVNLACVDKNDYPMLQVIVFSQANETHAHRLKREWEVFMSKMARYWRFKQVADAGRVTDFAPYQRCGKCEFCRKTSGCEIVEAESLVVV